MGKEPCFATISILTGCLPFGQFRSKKCKIQTRFNLEGRIDGNGDKVKSK